MSTTFGEFFTDYNGTFYTCTFTAQSDTTGFLPVANPMAVWGLLTVNSGMTTWTVTLEGSLDGVNPSWSFTATNASLHAEAGARPATYIRVTLTALTGGPGTLTCFVQGARA